MGVFTGLSKNLIRVPLDGRDYEDRRLRYEVTKKFGKVW